MSKPDKTETISPTPEVEDPHPGSISDGTHPAAREHKQPNATETRSAERVSGSSGKPAAKDEPTRINSEAPRHPNKGAYGT